MLQKTPFSFDVSVWEFFWPLLAGARLVLARPGGHKDPAYLAGLIRQEKVTVCHFVPSMLRAFLREPGLEDSCASLRDVMCSGEALPHDLQEAFFARLPARLHNLYGPTEAAVDVTYWECRRGDARAVVPIGRPVANTRMHVLDARMQPLPVGVPGELYIGGVQLARGYLNRPGLTAERLPRGGGAGARLYRTGDRGRWLADGSLEYLGRSDRQVKLRGFRIELGEVEAALLSQPLVREAAVELREGAPGDTRLVAYVAPRGAAPPAAALREHLRRSLPEYMVPSAFVVLDALPLSPNGKVDRKALPEPKDVRLTDEDDLVNPRTPTEEAVASVWSEVLGVGGVGAHDNFFDLGGHSLLATQVFSRLGEIIQTEVPLRRRFESPTVSGLAADIESRKVGEALPDPPVVPRPRYEEAPLSFAQQRLWFIDQWEPNSPQYNIATAVRLAGPLEANVLEQSLREVARRHEVLRTTFPTMEGQPVPVVAAEPDLSLPIIDLGGLPEGSAGGGGQAAGLRAGAAALRPGQGAAAARHPPAAGGAGACGPGGHAPHRLRRLVDGRIHPRGGGAVRGVRVGGGVALAAAGGAVRRLRRLAKAAAARGGPGAPAGPLAAAAGRRSRRPGSARRPPPGPPPPAAAAPACASPCPPGWPPPCAAWPGGAAARRSWCCWPPSGLAPPPQRPGRLLRRRPGGQPRPARRPRAWSGCSSTPWPCAPAWAAIRPSASFWGGCASGCLAAYAHARSCPSRRSSRS